MNLASLLGPLSGTAQRMAQRAWHRTITALDNKPERERAALGLLALAGLVALELVFVLPIRHQRQTVVAAVLAQERAQQEAEQARSDQLAAEETKLQARLVQVERGLRQRGAVTERSESLASWLQRALDDQSVAVVALRDLGMQELETVASATPAEPAPAAASADYAHLPLFRHRYELTLSGEVGALIQAVHTLGGRMRPLRIERVRLGSTDGAVVQVTLGFVILTPERTWISL